MKLGAFSLSLVVKDLKKSEAFYSKMGFQKFGGSFENKYLIMKNDRSLIGLFEGMFEKNMITFNPGWNENAQEVNPFTDIRDIQKSLKSKGIKLETEIKENTTGAASFVVKDPDGNILLIDQHR